ncbi:MAG: phospholipase D-like domain-containing protein [Gemmatimonadota bacterium]
MTSPVTLRTSALAADASERAIDRAANGRPLPGNQVRLLFDGPVAFDAMLEIIGAARRWVHFDNYIFRDDRVGELFAAALIARAKEGLAVRVSVDWFGSHGTSRKFWRRLTAAGITVRQFNRPGPFDLPSLLSRDHRKLVVADGERSVIGGICIGNEWAGDDKAGRLPWRDTAILIEGPASVVLDHAFARSWARIGPPLPDEEQAREVVQMGEAEVRVLVGEPIQERAYRVTELLLAQAATRVWITDAYLVAPRRLLRYLIDAARDGIDVRLLVPGTSDIPFIRNLTRIGYRDLLRAGVRIFEWNGPMLHAKTVVVDGRWVRVGSSNMNHSSLIANYELDALVDDTDLASRMEAQFRRDIDRSSEVTVRPRRGPPKLQPVLPSRLSIQSPDTEPGSHRAGMRERRGRSVLAVRTLVAGARLAIFGPLSVALIGVAVLFLLIPRTMAILFAVLSLWLAAVSGAEAIRRHREPRRPPA